MEVGHRLSQSTPGQSSPIRWTFKCCLDKPRHSLHEGGNILHSCVARNKLVCHGEVPWKENVTEQGTITYPVP